MASPSIDPPAMPAQDDPNVQVWRLPDGAIWAYARRLDGDRWLQLPGVGSFLLDGAADPITAFPHAGVSEEAVRDAYRRIVLPISFQVRGGEVFHASAVRGPRGVVAFCADSHGGKSTTAFALSRRGYRLWADDALALDFSADGVAAVMLPFRLRLRPASAQFFFGTARAADHTPAPIDEDGAPEPPAPLAAVFFLEQHGDGGGRSAPEAIPVAPRDAFLSVLAQAGCFTLQDTERKELMLRHYLGLCESVPFFTLQVPPGLARLSEVLDRIELVLPS